MQKAGFPVMWLKLESDVAAKLVNDIFVLTLTYLQLNCKPECQSHGQRIKLKVTSIGANQMDNSFRSHVNATL